MERERMQMKLWEQLIEKLSLEGKRTVREQVRRRGHSGLGPRVNANLQRLTPSLASKQQSLDAQQSARKREKHTAYIHPLIITQKLQLLTRSSHSSPRNVKLLPVP